MVLGAAARALRGGSSASDEAADAARGANFNFADDSFTQRGTAYVGGELANQPARIADSGTSALASTAKYGSAGAVGTSGIYFGNQAYQSHTASEQEQARQSTAQDFSDAAEEIMNNDGLTPEQKQDALAELRNMSDQALDVPGGGALSNIFGDLGMIEKVFLGLVVLAIVRALAQKWGEN